MRPTKARLEEIRNNAEYSEAGYIIDELFEEIDFLSSLARVERNLLLGSRVRKLSAALQRLVDNCLD